MAQELNVIKNIKIPFNIFEQEIDYYLLTNFAALVIPIPFKYLILLDHKMLSQCYTVHLTCMIRASWWALRKTYLILKAFLKIPNSSKKNISSLIADSNTHIMYFLLIEKLAENYRDYYSII